MQHPDLYIKQDLKFYWRGIILRRDREKQHPQIKNQKTNHMVIEMSHLVHCTNCFPAAQDMHGASQEAEGSSIRTTSIPPQTQHSLLELSSAHYPKLSGTSTKHSAGRSIISSYPQQNCVLFRHPLLNQRRALFGAQCQVSLLSQKQYATLKKKFTLVISWSSPRIVKTSDDNQRRWRKTVRSQELRRRHKSRFCNKLLSIR